MNGTADGGRGVAMITESITAEVPIKYADEEWTESMFRQLNRAYAYGPVKPTVKSERVDADACRVTFADRSGESFDVSVTVECETSSEEDQCRRV